jgi:hypothetical protein
VTVLPIFTLFNSDLVKPTSNKLLSVFTTENTGVQIDNSCPTSTLISLIIQVIGEIILSL